MNELQIQRSDAGVHVDGKFPISPDFKVGILYLLAVATSIANSGCSLQRALIYHPDKSIRLSFEHAEGSIVDVQLTSYDGTKLRGWLSPARIPTESERDHLSSLVSDARPLVIIFPGNAGNRSYRLQLINVFRSLNVNCLIFDYRGYGGNEGKPSEADIVRDAHSVWDFARNRLGVPANRIVIYGESLGGGTATRLAGDLGKAGIEPAGLIIQSTFNSLAEAGRYHFPILPVNSILVDRFESQKHVANVSCPILQLHGMKDDVVPVSLGQKLFDEAPEMSTSGIAKKQVLLPHANHNDVYDADRVLAIEALRTFLDGVERRSGSFAERRRWADYE